MKFTKNINRTLLVVILAFFCFNHNLTAQVSTSNKIPLTGKVEDYKTKAKLIGVRLEVFNQMDSLVGQSVSDAEGNFSLEVINAINQDFALVANLLGYSSKNLKFQIGPGIKQLGPFTISMEQGSIQLDAVDIVAKTVAVLNGDTTEFDASAFPTQPYADSDELIKQLPGTMVDEEGNLIVQGEQVTKILVDNKEFFTTDPRLALKNLPADIIDKIQIIDEKSEQSQFSGFDDGQRNKVINIVTKKDRRNGYFGKLNSGLGSLDRFAGQGNLSFFSPKQRLTFSGVSNNVNLNNFSLGEMTIDLPTGGRGRNGSSNNNQANNNRNNPNSQPGNTQTNTIGLNFNRSFFGEKMTFNADYSWNKTNSLVHSITNRETLVGNRANQFRFENNENGRLNQSQRLNLNIKWDLDSNQQLTFRPSMRIQGINSLVTAHSNTSIGNVEPQNQSNRTQTSDNNNINFSGDLNYRFRFLKRGRTFSANINSSLNSSRGIAQTYSLNEFFQDYSIHRTDTTNLKNHTETLGNGFSSRLTFTEPITQNHRLQANYALRNNSNFSNRETLNWLAETGQFSELNEQLSNTFDNDYLHHRAGLSYQMNQDKFNFDVGLDYQKSVSENHKTFPVENLMERDFESYLPNAIITFRPNRDIQAKIQYTSQTNAPSLQQLQDVINNQNPLNIRTGNPDLQQEYQHRFELSFNRVNRTKGSNLNASIQSHFSNNRVVNSTFIADQDTLIAPGVILGKGGQFTQPLNLDGYYSIRSQMSWGSPVPKLKINVNTRTALHLTHQVGMMNLKETASDSYGINQSVGVNSKISQKIIFGLQYNFSYQVSNSSLLENTSYTYINQNITTELNYIFWKGLRFNTTLKYFNNSGLSQGYNQNFTLWNAALGKKMFKKQQAELSLSVVDILNKNVNITRNVSEMYITDITSNTLKQFFMLNFTYNLRQFGAGFAGMNRGNRNRVGV